MSTVKELPCDKSTNVDSQPAEDRQGTNVDSQPPKDAQSTNVDSQQLKDRLTNVRSAFLGVREIIAKAGSILQDERYRELRRNTYVRRSTYVGGGIVTSVFGVVWYSDPTFLTLISIIGFLLTIIDCFGPKLLPYILSNNWN